ncbi:MAG TPA: outer membrane lipoprotein carrier protein LolA [Alphaproteobacteria bacterium]|nr:outer membrane lipoprotein carrier protein LolA [Alphaproteobacteria bacterium]
METKLLKRFLTVAALALLPLAGEAAVPATSLSAQDQADVARVEQYLNSIHTVAAHFLQVSSDGGVTQGKFYLERPGKLRIQYDPPNPLLMVASGIYLTVYDPQLKQTTYLPIDSTPAYFLLKDKVGMGNDITVSKVERGKDSLRVSVHETNHPDSGRLTLVFSDKPLELRKWTVFDHDGKEIDVSLVDAHFGAKLDPDLFKFVDPSPSKGSRP